jgi:hypothetical protein
MLMNVLRIAALTCVFSAFGWAFQSSGGDSAAHVDGAHSGITRYPICTICGQHHGNIQYWVPYVKVTDPAPVG